MATSTTSKTGVAFHGSRTERNIVQSYLNESSAYTRYTFYAQQADKENYYPVGQVFRFTADNELHHAKVFFRMLLGGKAECPAQMVDAGIIGDTATNLKIAIEEEKAEGYVFYLECAKVAREEGFDGIADHFEAIASVERHHHARYERYLKMVENGTLWKREKPIKWQCLVCGYVFEGTEPPKVCPACDHPYQHYMAQEDVL